MAISFTDEFGIDKEAFRSTGAFDPVLDVDSRFFIDPALLPHSGAVEFDGSREEVERYFSGIVSLLRASKKHGDRFWKRADELFQFKEIKGTCLGYSEKSVSGNAIGGTFRTRILESIAELLETGSVDPILFELLGVFEEGIGCDRISDLLTFKLYPRICKFTERVMEQIGFAGDVHQEGSYTLPFSRYSGTPILLLPRDILHPLPLAEKFSDIGTVALANSRVREAINKWFDFSDGSLKVSKGDIFYAMKKDTDFRDAFVDAYKTAHVESYDFDRDPFGENDWYKKGKLLAVQSPLWLDSSGRDGDSLVKIVTEICRHFKRLVERNGAWELLFDDSKTKPRSERYVQHLFSAVASSYCEANDIDISPEVNNGNGPVDFKFSHGYRNKTLVEIKMSKSSQLDHCIEKQIPIYMEQEGVERAIYLIINTGNDKKVNGFIERYQKLGSSAKEKIVLITVDAKPKKSASKA